MYARSFLFHFFFPAGCKFPVIGKRSFRFSHSFSHSFEITNHRGAFRLFASSLRPVRIASRFDSFSMDSFFLLFLFNRRERAEALQLFTSYTKKWEIASDRVFNSYEQRVTYELCVHESRLLRNATLLLSRRGDYFREGRTVRSRKRVLSYLYDRNSE